MPSVFGFTVSSLPIGKTERLAWGMKLSLNEISGPDSGSDRTMTQVAFESVSEHTFTNVNHVYIAMEGNKLILNCGAQTSE